LADNSPDLTVDGARADVFIRSVSLKQAQILLSALHKTAASRRNADAQVWKNPQPTGSGTVSSTRHAWDERLDQDQSTGSTLQPGRAQENIRNRLNANPIRAER